MSLYKRGNIWWTSEWIDGKRTLQSLETSNRREAERRARAIEDELHSRRFHLPELRPEMTFGELYTRFLAEGDVKAHHLDRAKCFLPFFEDMPIGRITKNDATRYRKHRHAEHARLHKPDAKPLTDATVNRDLSVVRHILYWALDEGYIVKNPFTRLRLARERRKRRPVVPVFDEVRLLLACGAHLFAIVILALDTGMRRGELLHQLWEDIDFDRRLIFVTLSKTPEGQMRPIPMTQRAFDLLSAMRKPSGRVFLYRGKALRNIKRAWAAAIRRAGINRYRFHDLRHTFNTRLLEAHVIADTRKELMGHSDGNDVHAGYSHVEVHLLREAIGQLEAWYTAKLKSLPTAGEVRSLPSAGDADQPRKEESSDEVDPS